MFNYWSLFAILFFGIIATAHEGSAASSDLLSRERRDNGGGGLNLIQLFLKFEKLVDNCKKSNSPPNNSTNAIVYFIESHDIQCLIDGAIKIYQDLTPKQNATSRRRRDVNNLMMLFLKLAEDIDKCKKANPEPAGNSTNFIQAVLNQYDLGCLIKSAITFIQAVAQNNKQRSKRAVDFADISCFVLKVLDDEKKITDLVKSFQRQSRSKRAATSEKMCQDFGVFLDSLINFIGDFAPNRNNASTSQP